jgi:hypothetical protein
VLFVVEVDDREILCGKAKTILPKRERRPRDMYRSAPVEQKSKLLRRGENLLDEVYINLLVGFNDSGLCDKVQSLPSLSPDATSAPLQKAWWFPYFFWFGRLLFDYI